MKKILALFFLLPLLASAQTPAFKRSGTNLPFVTTISANQVLMIDRGSGLPPANVTFDSLTNNLTPNFRNHFAATNTPTRGLNDRAAMVPDLTVSAWYVYSGWSSLPQATNTSTSGANFVRWFTNLIQNCKTNGFFDAGWRSIATDGGWAQTSRTAGGQLTWNTNIFDNFGFTLPQLITYAHTNGWKVKLYSAVTTNSCDPPSSPIDKVYADIQLMMSWGADGVKLDNCAAAGETNTYYRDYFRIANQAIDDYYRWVAATNGVLRPFNILNTGSSGEGFPNSIDSDGAFGKSQTTFQPTYIAVGAGNPGYVGVAPWNSTAGSTTAEKIEQAATNLIELNREVLKFTPFIRPGHLIYTGIGVYGMTPTHQDNWTNLLTLFSMACQPLEAGIGSGLGTFDSADQWTIYWPAISKYLTNSEVLEILQDRLVIPAVVTSSNVLVETWSRPLANGDTAICISSLATTNRTVTVTAGNCRVKPGVAYVARDPWAKANLFTFTNSFSWTQPKRSAQLLRLTEVKPTTVTATDNLWTGLNTFSKAAGFLHVTNGVQVWGTGTGLGYYLQSQTPTDSGVYFMHVKDNTWKFENPSGNYKMFMLSNNLGYLTIYTDPAYNWQLDTPRLGQPLSPYAIYGNSLTVESNTAAAAVPSAPYKHGEARFWNSNGVLYLLTSGNGLTWTATNKIAP